MYNKIRKPKLPGKVGLLSALMFLSVTFGWAQEQWARVIRQMDSPSSNDPNTIDTTILFDVNDDNRPDFSLLLYSTNRVLLHMLLKEDLRPESLITINRESIRPANLPYIAIGDILEIDNIDVLDLYPETERLFTAVARKRAEAARQSQPAQRGGR